MKRKKKGNDGPKGLAGWFATYADMVTLMMVFFILLFSMSVIDEGLFAAFVESFQGDRFANRGGAEHILGDDSMFEHPPEPLPTPEPIRDPEEVPGDPTIFEPRTPGEVAAEMASALRTYLAPHMPSDPDAALPIVVDVIDDYMRVIIQDMDERAHFNSGEATLLPEAIGIVNMLGEALVMFAELGHRIIVEGHADAMPLNPNSPFRDNRGLSAMRASAVVSHLVDVWNIPGDMIESHGMGDHHPVDTNDTPEGRARNRRVEIKVSTTVTGEVRRGTTGFNIPGISS